MTTQREDFEAWLKSEPQAESEPDRSYELDEDGMNQLTEDCMWVAWQAATKQAQAMHPSESAAVALLREMQEDAAGFISDYEDKIDAVLSGQEQESVPDGWLIDWGFTYTSSIHTPTVLVGFPTWNARDAFARTLPSAPTTTQEQDK